MGSKGIHIGGSGGKGHLRRGGGANSKGCKGGQQRGSFCGERQPGGKGGHIKEIRHRERTIAKGETKEKKGKKVDKTGPGRKPWKVPVRKKKKGGKMTQKKILGGGGGWRNPKGKQSPKRKTCSLSTKGLQ